MGNLKFLHVGCGLVTKESVKGFSQWDEIRFDIDPKVNPDIIGTLTDMVKVQSESMDAIYSSHNIEHLYPHEVPLAIDEFFRVLRPNGFVVITCPDIQSVCAEVSKGNLLGALYQSDAGPISAIDILYGHRDFIASGNTYTAHKTAFTFPVLSDLFFKAGFKNVYGGATPEIYAIWLVATKSKISNEELTKLGNEFLP